MLNRRVNDLVQVPGSPEEQVHEALSGTQRFFVEGPTNCFIKGEQQSHTCRERMLQSEHNELTLLGDLLRPCSSASCTPLKTAAPCLVFLFLVTLSVGTDAVQYE